MSVLEIKYIVLIPPSTSVAFLTDILFMLKHLGSQPVIFNENRPYNTSEQADDSNG